MGKRNLLTKKREPDGVRKKAQEEEAAHAFEEFVATFQETPGKTDKVWVKAGTYDAGRRHEDTRDKGKLYKPQSRLSDQAGGGGGSTADKAEEYARMMGERKPDAVYRKKGRDEKKKKSNLEIFKDELKLIQEEREDRHKYKGSGSGHSGGGVGGEGGGGPPPPPHTKYSLSLEDSKTGSHDMGDPNTTNLYLGNLNPKITQQQLMEVFGKYGPLASIKIMWPRSEEERARGRHTGFVAFMTRKDGERAMKGLKGKEVFQHEMKLGWGKTVPIPPRPIYIPPAMLELSRPPPASGLPFNAQAAKGLKLRPIGPRDPYPDDLDSILRECVVKVTVPAERGLLMTIHRTVEFVLREGPMFEAMIMNREMNNPMFRFLFENQSPAHTYYRWKLYSLLQGDTPHHYRTTEFRMFAGGSIWKPPTMNPFAQGMPEELIEEEETETTRGSLSATQRDRLEDLIRNITQERAKIAEVMVFCIEHAEAGDEICECISDSMSSARTAPQKKIARLYLVSDILHNCSVKVSNVSFYRRGLEVRLLEMFRNMHAAYNAIGSRLKADGFKARVLKVVKAWEEWAVYPREFLIRLQNTFLGLQTPAAPASRILDDIDGEHIDGVALRLSSTPAAVASDEASDDIDGVPMVEDNIDGVPLKEEDEGPMLDIYTKQEQGLPCGFVTSKWEIVDPDQIEAQAMTTSKWDQLEGEAEGDGEVSGGEEERGENDEDFPSTATRDTALNEERRARLREIELKAVQYQDELEAGTRTLKGCWSVTQQVEHYRRKLLRKAGRDEREQRATQAATQALSIKKEKDKDKDGDSSSRSGGGGGRSRKRGRSSSSSGSTSPARKPRPRTTPSPPARSRHSRVATPSPPRIKHRSSPPPARKRRTSPPSPPRSKRRGGSPPPSPPSPPRHKQHKHRR